MATKSESKLGNNEKTSLPKEKLVESFLDVEDTLNELFDAVLGRKHKLHSVMEELLDEVKQSQKKIRELNKTIEEQKNQLKDYTDENAILKAEIKELKDPQNATFSQSWKGDTSGKSRSSTYGYRSHSHTSF